jgi:hypothetical protein
MTGIYRGMSQRALDAAYNNQAAVADFPGMVARWRDLSADAMQSARAQADLAYGSKERQRIDYFPARQPGAPLLFFIHGGYWQGGEKRSVGFLAKGPVERGFAVALVEYTVAPEGSMAGMIEEVKAALAWSRDHAAELGFDPARIVLAGHSAGAHLLCMAYGEPGVIAGIAISGLYDLEPILLSYLNAKLGLTASDVERFSPMRHLPPAGARIVVTVGANELPELVRQSAEFAADAKLRLLPVAGHDHFSILDELARRDGQLCELLEPLAAS